MTRKQKAIIAVVVLAVVALAFGVGVLVQREYQLARVDATEQLIRGLTGQDCPVPPAPPWEQWRYPGAESRASIGGSSTRVMGKLVQAAGRYAMLVTPDDLDAVAKFYAEKAEFKNPNNVATSRNGVSSTGRFPEGVSFHRLDDCMDPADPQKSRPVVAKCLMRRGRSYDLTVFLTRAEGETHTHIVLVYDPKTETGVPR